MIKFDIMKVEYRLIFRFSLLVSFFLLFSACSNDADKLVGLWQRTVEKDDVTYIESYNFEGKSTDNKITYSLLPTDKIHVGYIVEGTWEVDKKGKLKIFENTESLVPAYDFNNQNNNFLMEISQYLSMLKLNIERQNEEMTFSDVEYKFENGELILITASSLNNYQEGDLKAYASLLAMAKRDIGNFKNNSINSDYPNYDWLSEREATYEDLDGKSDKELRIMRNYIFARHGYMFRSQDLQEYFSNYPWYSPRYSDVTRDLNSIEMSNIEYIKRFE